MEELIRAFMKGFKDNLNLRESRRRAEYRWRPGQRYVSMKESIVAAKWYTDPNVGVTHSKARLSRAGVTRTLHRWIERQGRGWPAQVNADALVEEMRCVFVPHLMVDASVSFLWSGSVTVPYTDPWSRQKNVVRYRTEGRSGSVVDEVVEMRSADTDGLWNSGFLLECKELDLRAAKARCTPLGRGDGVDVIGATWKTGEDVTVAGDALMDEALRSVVDRRAGRHVRDLVLHDVKYGTKKYTILLYPLLVSHYRYGGATYQVQVDSYTRRVWVETGLRMRIARSLWAVAERAARFAAVVFIGSYIALGVGWCRGVRLDNFFRNYDTAGQRGGVVATADGTRHGTVLFDGGDAGEILVAPRRAGRAGEGLEGDVVTRWDHGLGGIARVDGSGAVPEKSSRDHDRRQGGVWGDDDWIERQAEVGSRCSA